MTPMQMLKNVFAILILAVITSAASAQLTPYSEDFEALDPTNPDVLGQAGWVVFGNVFNENDVFQYGYGTEPAPNGTGGFSDLATGQGGPEQGANQLNTFNDYLNGDHNINPTWTIEANIFREQFITAADLGTTWTFNFQMKSSTEFAPMPPSTTGVFLKVLDFNAFTFAELGSDTFDTTLVPDTWGGGTVELFIDPSWEGQLLQFGFVNTASGFSPTGIFYDNLVFEEMQAPSFIPTESLSVFRGILVSGTLAEVQGSDDTRMELNPGFTINNLEAPVWVIFGAELGGGNFDLMIESQAGTPGLTYTAEHFNYNTGTYDVLGTMDESFSVDTVETFPITPADHIDGSGASEARIGWRRTGFTINFPWTARIDLVGWQAN